MAGLAEFDTSVEEAWREFRARLADQLAVLQRGSVVNVAAYPPSAGLSSPPHVRIRLVRNRLIANVPVQGERLVGADRRAGLTAYLHDSWRDAPVEGARARWQQVSWHLKTRRCYADWLAVQVVELLRDGFDVLHPSLLDAPADLWDTDAPEGSSMDDEDVIAQLSEPELSAAHQVANRDELEALVLATLAPHFGHTPRRDEDGDIPVVSEHNVTYVRVSDDSPSVQLFCWPVANIANAEAARTEVRILNRDFPIVSFVHVEDRILARATVLAFPFVPRHLADLLHNFTRLMDRICVDLAERVQGQRWDERVGGERVDEGDLG